MEAIHMARKFEFPVSMPRWTKEEFDEQREKYVAKHGYEIHVPGFSDIFHIGFDREPSAQELELYKAKDVTALGEKRYSQIKDLMDKKRERFLRLLASPTPRTVMNAATALTFLDDINDTLGTVGVLARTAAHLLPSTAAKLMAGPAGWAFTAAEITNIAMALCRMPWKAKRLQHDLHAALMLNPVSKKARLRRLNKLKRLKLSKGEIIEGLQTTDNVFGIGISLGPIMGLLYDIPSGIYRALQGRPVKVTGLPAPFYAVDRTVSRMVSGAAQLFYGPDDFTDDEKSRAMLGYNYATQWQKAHLGDNSPLDLIDDPSGIEIPAPRPEHPSTIEVVQNEVGDVDKYVGWPAIGKRWMQTNEMIDNHLTGIFDSIKGWIGRKNKDMFSNVAAQNMSEAGLNTLAILEGDGAVEWDYNAVGNAYLKLLNIGYRLPLDATQEQLNCLTEQFSAYDAAGEELTRADISFIVRHVCDLQLTTQVPERNTQDDYILDVEAKHGIERLREWYYYEVSKAAHSLCFSLDRNRPDFREPIINVARPKCAWLNRYGFPKDPPRSTMKLETPERAAKILSKMRELGCQL
jgi:hypothetical protein